MRPQVQPLWDLNSAITPRWEDDLGWDDMGDHPDRNARAAVALNESADQSLLVRYEFSAGATHAEAVCPVSLDEPTHRQRVAFTLRLDRDRHLKLRLASVISDRSAQQILTEALDQYLQEHQTG
jgi:hypothetical protein